MLQNFCSNRATNYKLTKTVWSEVHFCFSRPVEEDLPWTRIKTAYYYLHTMISTEQKLLCFLVKSLAHQVTKIALRTSTKKASSDKVKTG